MLKGVPQAMGLRVQTRSRCEPQTRPIGGTLYCSSIATLGCQERRKLAFALLVRIDICSLFKNLGCPNSPWHVSAYDELCGITLLPSLHGRFNPHADDKVIASMTSC